MRTGVSAILLCLGVSLSALGQVPFPSYYSAADLSLTSPGALKFGLYGYDNPAILTSLHQPDLQFSWTDATGRWNDLNRWGLFVAVPNLGFAAVKTKSATTSITDYRLSAGFGDKTLGFGVSYSFTGGDKSAFNRRNAFSVGTLLRPDPRLSVGFIGSTAATGGGAEAAIDVGVRPFGNEWLTFFADYGIHTGQSLTNGNWSSGAAVEALPGIRVTARYFDTHAFSVGLALSLGNLGLAGQSTWDNDARHSFNTYSIRLGAYDRTILSRLMQKSSYVELNLHGTMKYQRFMLFDNSNTLSRTLAAIQAARDDETVSGIAINTSGMNINRQMLWELREQLREFKSAGKKVVVFIDRPSMEQYHFASVADKIVLDPIGLILLPGYATGRTFLKGMLEKIGLGYDEWRFFTYKSAVENLSRDKMSEADREQRQQFVDDLYNLAKREICEGRRFSTEKFERVVNDDAIFLPEEAVAAGLVDTLGRWEEVLAMVERLEGENKRMAGTGSLAAFNLPSDHRWGERPRIALIYAIGECAMDAGIKARSLAKVVEAAGNDPRIKAIVLRVDSPGGDGTAADYVAEAMKKANKNKPVIVSQGLVAGSGGYWLSMYADTIIASPNTMTGSIGVIGGWIYNKELKEKLGMSTDFVQAGKHADLGFGFMLPFLGVGVPDRNLSDEERTKMERAMKSFYREFIRKVAAGRNTSPEKIEPIAQGRFYSGYEGKHVGLVDVLGGLETALQLAKKKAGIDVGDEVTIVESPPRGLIDLSQFLPRLPGTDAALVQDPLIEHLLFRLKHNGQPLPLMPLEWMEFEGAAE